MEAVFMRFVGTLLLIAGSVFVLPAQKYTITTVAGSTNGLGDGGIAALAALIQPVAVVADAAGNIYISDQINSRIRKIDGKTGMISTLTTVPSSPAGLAVNRAGTYLYVADDTNHRIRKVDTKTGATTNFAGTGSGGFSGDGYAATGARLRNPKAVWVDAGNNVFIAGTKNNRIRRVDGSTGVIRTIAGRGGQNATVSTPAGTAALTVNNVAGDGGKATQAQLANPEGVIGDEAGNIYIADTNFNRIRKVDTAGRITTIAGRGTAGSTDATDAMQAELNAPRGLAFDSSGNLFIADSSNNRVRELMLKTRILRTVAGAGSGGDEKQAQIAALSFPSGIGFDVDGKGNVYFTDRFGLIKKLTAAQ
jgi:sugar lactone lactonase YvrE